MAANPVVTLALATSAAGFRKLAVDHLCQVFDASGALASFSRLEDARQKLVIALSLNWTPAPQGEAGDLARLIHGARCGGETIQQVIDLIRADFGKARREALLSQGWIV